jgi:N-acetylmuramoyl-L-alanine amidase
VAGTMAFGTATGVSAAPADNANCIAQFTHAFGSPGHGGPDGGPVGGSRVSEVAHQSKEICATIND